LPRDRPDGARIERRVRRHAIQAVAHELADDFALDIGEHDVGAQQVWPALVASAQVAAVTGHAVDLVEPVAALDDLCGRERALLRRKGRVWIGDLDARTVCILRAHNSTAGGGDQRRPD
jgi:hypothetical protein